MLANSLFLSLYFSIFPRNCSRPYSHFCSAPQSFHNGFMRKALQAAALVAGSRVRYTFSAPSAKGSWSVLRGTSSSDVHGLGRINEGSCQCSIYRILVLVRWSNSSRNPLIPHPSNVGLRRLYPTISVHFQDWPAEQES